MNATAMCKAAGRMIGHWSQNNNTRKVLASLSPVIGIPITENLENGERGLVIIRQGGRPVEQDTWAADTAEANHRLTRQLGVNRKLLGAAAETPVKANEDLSVKEGQREAAVTEKQEEERKAAAMARAEALEAESRSSPDG